jgi:hypothetical protein
MENFLSKFANADTQVQSSNANLSVSAEFHGTIDISKGALKMSINFFARLYKSRYENFVSIDDWEIQETKNIEFDSIPVDDLNALKVSMRNSGLSTLAKGLEIEDKEIKKEIAIQIGQSKLFKSIYGKTAMMFETLSEEHKKKVFLRFAIDNYENEAIRINHEISMFLVEDEQGAKVNPSREQLVEMYKQLNQ